MPVPTDPPNDVGPSAFREWAQDVADTAQDHETRIDAIETAPADAMTAAEIVATFTGTPDGTTFLRDDGTLVTPSGGGSGSGNPLVHIQDQKSSGTGGGATTSGSWQTHTLNTVLHNGISGASLASNAVSLPAGDYEVRAEVSLANADRAQVRIQNVTASSTLLLGPVSNIPNTGICFVVPVAGRFTLGATSSVQLQYRVNNANSDGLGLAASWGTEVYTDLMIWKVG